MVGMIRYNYHAFCTKVAMDFADEFNYLDILDFLHEHHREGCTARAFYVAIHLGYVTVLEWLMENYSALMASEDGRVGGDSGRRCRRRVGAARLRPWLRVAPQTTGRGSAGGRVS